MKLRLLCILFLLPAVLFAQHKKKPGKAPFRKTFDYKVLAHALTDGLTDDSLKVRSIFLWESRHIRYGGGATDPNAILLGRRAVCYGISILFDSLCSVAGIHAAIVPGYVYMPWYEARDTMYVDTHAWNAVLVDSVWKLVDVTWCMGSLKMKKQHFARFLNRFFKVKIRLKYKFSRNPNTDFYMTDPEKFILTHLPATPAWQLLDCSVPIDSFQWSPQATQGWMANPRNCHRGNDSIPLITQSPQYRQMVVAGKQALAFSKNNHQDISLGYSLFATHNILLAEDTTLFYTKRIAFYDTSMVQFDSTAMYFKATSKDFDHEGAFFIRRNKRMNKIAINETRPLMRGKQAYANAAHRAAVTQEAKVRRLHIQDGRLRGKKRHMRRYKIHVQNRRTPKKGDEDIIKKLQDHLSDNDQLIADYSDSTSYVNFRLFIPQEEYYFTLMDTLLRHARFESDTENLLVVLRALFYNSYDTIVMNTVKARDDEQHVLDSIRAVIPPFEKWSTDSAAVLNKKYVAKIQALLKDNMHTCVQLGRFSKTNFDEKKKFKNDRQQSVAWNDSLLALNHHLIDVYRRDAHVSGRMSSQSRHMKNSLVNELHYENYRFTMTNRFFFHYYRDYSKAMKQNVSSCRKLKMKIKQRKRQYQQEQKNKIQKHQRLQKQHIIARKREKP